MKAGVVMIKLLLCLFILVGCTRTSVDVPESPYPIDYDWTGITYEWVTEQEIPFKIGSVISKGSGYFPFNFQTQDGTYSFYYVDWLERNYSVYGRWDDDSVYFDLPDMTIVYSDQDAEKTAVISLDAMIDTKGIVSDCLLKTEKQILKTSIDTETGDFLLIDAETNQDVKIENDQLWMNSYSVIYEFYEFILKANSIVSATRDKFWETQGFEIANNTQSKTAADYKLNVSDEFWERNPLLLNAQMAVDYQGKSYDPWSENKYETPQITEILKSIDLTAAEKIPSGDSELELTLFTIEMGNLLGGVPTVKITYIDDQFWVNSDFGKATFESKELLPYIEGLFDEETATQELLKTIEENEIVKAYIRSGVDEVKVTEVTDQVWLYQLVRDLSDCKYTSSLTSESFAELTMFVIYQQNGELKSLNIVQTSDSTAWIRYEGKFTEFVCPNVLENINKFVNE